MKRKSNGCKFLYKSKCNLCDLQLIIYTPNHKSVTLTKGLDTFGPLRNLVTLHHQQQYYNFKKKTKNKLVHMTDISLVEWFLISLGLISLFILTLIYLTLRRIKHENDNIIQDKDAAKKMRSPSGSAIIKNTKVTNICIDRSIDILVYNVSHSDMILSIEAEGFEGSIYARPTFHKYNEIGVLINQALSECNNIPEMIKWEDGNIHYGYEVNIRVDTGHLRFRELEKSNILAAVKDGSLKYCYIKQIYFPLLATLVSKWMKQLDYDQIERTIYFVCGAGVPIHDHFEKELNSTHEMAKTMRRLLKTSYEGKFNIDLEVDVINSEKTNLFRYDENMYFVKKDLVPKIDEMRDNLVKDLTIQNKKSAEDWKKKFSVTVGFADGSSARVGAINSSLRHYRPSYIHFTHIKRFWLQKELDISDVEVHSFAEWEMNPAIDVKDLSSEDCKITQKGIVSEMVEEMNKFYNEFIGICNKRCHLSGSPFHELNEFWLRKTKKPVLSVLVVQNRDDEGELTGMIKLVRSTNMEVSMPTGSLCAERNAVGTALSQDLELQRRDILGVAVLGVSIPSETRPKSDTGPHSEKIKVPSSPIRKDVAMRSFKTARNDPNISTSTSSSSSPRSGSFDESATLGAIVDYLKVDDKDRNPLRPCGACTEWLMKIAEVNPRFFVVTFTDEMRQGVFIQEMADEL
jgi:cytidine deaminase